MEKLDIDRIVPGSLLYITKSTVVWDSCGGPLYDNGSSTGYLAMTKHIWCTALTVDLHDDQHFVEVMFHPAIPGVDGLVARGWIWVQVAYTSVELHNEDK